MTQSLDFVWLTIRSTKSIVVGKARERSPRWSSKLRARSPFRQGTVTSAWLQKFPDPELPQAPPHPPGRPSSLPARFGVRPQALEGSLGFSVRIRQGFWPFGRVASGLSFIRGPGQIPLHMPFATETLKASLDNLEGYLVV